MKHNFKIISWFLFFSLIFVMTSFSAAEEAADKTLSPYFLVKSDDPSVDQLPLKSTFADVDIAGVIADVRVSQIYKNEGKSTIEAVYVFPASTRAAVYGMKMSIGERTVIAEIREREKARQEYEAAKEAGKSASLLEQQRPNVFQMNVANILPGDEIKVELSYTELLIPDDGVYEFVYPSVTGPRYSNLPESQAPSSEKWVKNPYLHEGESPNYTFDIITEISAGMPIDEVVCPSHKTNIDFESRGLASVKLDKSEKYGGNRDFILKYKLNGGNIQTGMLLYKGEKENFFLLMMQPPKRISVNQIPPREYIFILDVSGSMYGFPLDVSKVLMKNLIENLRPSDRFNVLLFSGGSQLLSESSIPANAENVKKAVSLIENQRGGGGTELLPALKRALELPGEEAGSRSIVIVTDGFVRVEKEAFDLIRNRLGDANMFTFGIGSSVNRYLIEGMARAGMGEPFIVVKPEEAAEKAEKLREYIQTPVLTNIDLSFNGFKVYDIEPPAVPDILAQRPVILFGKWRGKPEGSIRLKGFTGEQPYNAELDVEDFTHSQANSGLKYLWARHKIALLSDYNTVGPDDDLEKEITKIGLDYNLLTQYTSFVAVDNRIRNKDGKFTTVRQPLPLPQGVSDNAVGGGYITRGSSRGFGNMALRSPMAMEAAPAPAPPPYPAIEADKKLKNESLSGFTVRIDKISVEGSMSKSYLKNAIQQHIKEIEKCINLKGESLSKGSEAVLKIFIRADGGTASVNIISKDMSEAVKRCIMENAGKWQFNYTDDGRPVNITCLLVFEPRS